MCSIIEPPVLVIGDPWSGKPFNGKNAPGENDSLCITDHVLAWLMPLDSGWVMNQFMEVYIFVHLLRAQFMQNVQKIHLGNALWFIELSVLSSPSARTILCSMCKNTLRKCTLICRKYFLFTRLRCGYILKTSAFPRCIFYTLCICGSNLFIFIVLIHIQNLSFQSLYQFPVTAVACCGRNC